MVRREADLLGLIFLPKGVVVEIANPAYKRCPWGERGEWGGVLESFLPSSRPSRTQSTLDALYRRGVCCTFEYLRASYSLTTDNRQTHRQLAWKIFDPRMSPYPTPAAPVTRVQPPGGPAARPQDLAVADADAFMEGSDGMFAKVEAPSSHLVRLWICVKPWRLYEGLGSRTIEALGLDPTKGVMVCMWYVLLWRRG